MKIHQVKTRYSNTYIAEGQDHLLVVDVAARCDGWVIRFIEEEMKRPISDVELVVCTHDDRDHIGGIYSLAKAAGANVGIPYASRRPHLKLLNNPFGPLVKIGTSFREAFRQRSRAMYANAERNQRYKFVRNHHLTNTHQKFRLPEHRLKHGTCLKGFEDWQVIHTPGHSWDSVCFFHQASGSLITGDTVLGSSKRGSLVHPAIFDDRAALASTIKKLSVLNPKTVYPGHGSVFDGDELLSLL